MTGRHWTLGAVLALTAIAASPAAAFAPLPDWQQLERFHQQDNGTGMARQSILAALPPGTPIATARAALVADGATCRRSRGRPGTEACLIHQYSLLDGAADDVRWTLTLMEEGGQVTTVLVDRSVDRHGSA
jgi:hypothetical protein